MRLANVPQMHLPPPEQGLYFLLTFHKTDFLQKPTETGIFSQIYYITFVFGLLLFILGESGCHLLA
jgi:hypothetical protein